ncbi:hypothetical protein BBO99_00004730 [Phytophthora kernoviae]|uniref:EGF-like domain-containing protein n=2 Tax=Phytophthora kernoviae TaxID=325452 RepID=A0A421F7K6_9STRA|nr:hypothetical protein G195_003358 [Phytophthora kernoviae 00238/432]KAG2529322.1 hypothetical protein JM16_001822 [Phytophthora kernoviae]KAG2530420.1 hypothetical protein JM18_002247 [Phytophthora kernoviae]RLN27063.1 hypothetical protein BBI17_002499 [Phytophthora kernoviae]RLN80130.1 hypothetical protein BBO99_00004730 [Phytophthora kernoviae]
MREAAVLQDDRNFFVSTTYTLWDADKVMGCQCDPGYTGTFALSFRGRVTTNLSPTDLSETLKAVLEALDNIYGVDITAGTQLCSPGGTSTTITFTNNPGDLPNLQVLNNLSNGALVTCPMGAAWFDGATAPNIAHAPAQCSNRGSCNTGVGVCSCLAPFTGAACDLLRCPSGITATGATCSGRGTCKTIQQLSSEAEDPQGNPLGVTYGATPNTPATWDATKIQGCDCITNDYFGPYENAYGDFTGGHDCYMLACPRGADPFEIGKVNEKQTLACTADGGVFTLTFRGETTAVIPVNAGEAQVQSALQALDSVRTATISFTSSSTVCDATPVTTTIEFTFMQGDLPPLGFDASALTLTSSTAVLNVGELVKGSKANIECSSRGVCDRTTGVCACYPYFLSSDGAGGLGRRGDCGYISPYPTVALS